MRVEGVYTYFCENCYTFFAVVSRFSVKGDYIESLSCPKCLNNSHIVGEGSLHHECYKTQSKVPSKEQGKGTLPELLTADHIAEYMKVSKRVAYEIMEQKDFPLIRIRRSKRVNKEDFIRWLNSQQG